MTQGKEISVLTIIYALFFLFYWLIKGGNYVGEIYY